jgi:hypothetical protein
MKYRNNCVVLLFVLTTIFVSCVRKKDFEFNKVKWDEITPAWGLPLANSRITVDQVLNKNNSDLIILTQPEGFITFVYLDTVISPLGEVVLESFKASTINLDAEFNLGNQPVPPVGIGQTFPLPSQSGTIPLELDSLEEITKMILKAGKLRILGSSDLRHEVNFTLTLPDFKKPSGETYAERFRFQYNPLRGAPTLDEQAIPNLAGYSISSPNGSPNRVAYTISDITVTVKSDNGITANPILSTQKIRFDIDFTELKYKTIIGKFKNLHVRGIPEGSTNINVFDNTLTGNIRFQDPSIKFTFENSYGIGPSINIQNAIMYYAYKSTPTPLLTNSSSTLKIPGKTNINSVPISQIGGLATTVAVIDTNTSNIADVLTGAPYQFDYSIPEIGLVSANGQDAFISDDSKIQINTEVKLPLFGDIRELVITDTSEISLPNARNVDYIEFKAGSDNSIPLSVGFQVYFVDSTLKNPLDTTKYIFLDSLVSTEKQGIVVAPGDIIATDSDGNITKTAINRFTTAIPVTKEKYARISSSNRIIVKGIIRSKGTESGRSVKFFTWQECTFKLSAFARLRIDPSKPEEITEIGK